PAEIKVWASHGDFVAAPPRGFAVVATSANAPVAAMANRERGLYALLFHPEVVHTESGLEILRNFAYGVCGCTADWTMASFIDVFEEEAAKLGQVDFLAQGTLYPDVIESVSIVGQSALIKSHHNVGGLPERMRMKLVEPLRELFKDEVRVVGRQLGLDEEFVVRQPFPGPGLAVRILGEVTKRRLDLLRRADAVVAEDVRRDGGS